jgi:CRP/FNR family transcriptional regulator, cyclic AMP receptor protein
MIGTAEQLLGSLPLFTGVRREVIAEVAKAAVPHVWSPGKVLFQRGDASRFLIAMESGHVRISLQTAGGRELVLQHVRGRAVVGEIGLLDRSTRTADATVITPTVGVLLDGARYGELMDRHPDLARAAIGHLCKLLRYTTDHIETIALYGLDARLARFLLAQSDAGATFELTLNQSEIADLIGASRPKVNQALGALEAASAIRRTGAAVTCDRAALRKIAGHFAEN